MKRKKLELMFRRAFAGGMSVAMLLGMTACQNTKSQEEPAKSSTESGTPEISEDQGASDEGAADETAGAGNYLITEENENEEVVMNDQPESSYWFPEQLLEWNPDEEKDLAYNVSTVPLAERADREKLQTVNSTQNKDTQVMAINIMNSSTSGNSPHGLNRFKANTFGYLQYVDLLVYWGGSSGEGLIVAPSPDVTDMAHKNGVKVIGTCFFPQAAHGGKLEWLDTFLTKNEDGSFPIIAKLAEVAHTYGFDGWFINQESEGDDTAKLTKAHADLMQEFIAAFKAENPDLELVYYDSMTVDGEMDWQNALTDKNAAYMVDAEGNAMSDSMFLNFWWTEDKLADQELLKASAEKAAEIGADPYDLYAGMDVQANGYMTPERWDLFENPEGGTYTSLGLYCPSWAWSTASDPNDMEKKENVLWVNSKGDPSVAVENTDPTGWRGVSTYVVERTALTSLPFSTNFNVGNGYNFFIHGEMVSNLDWNNRSLADVLPTYRWMMENEGGNKLTPSFYMADAYYGGNSLRLFGNMDAGAATKIKLYSASLPVAEGTAFTTTAKASQETALELILTLEDGSEITAAGDAKVGADWTTVNYDISEAAGKTVTAISYRIVSDAADDAYQLLLGNISIGDVASVGTGTVSDVKVDGSEFDEDAMLSGVRLSWSVDSPAEYYEIFRINQDGTKSLLGASNNTCFYINTLPRTDDTNKSVFEVVPVNKALEEGTGAQVTMDWPNNSLPKSDFTADRTLIAPGMAVAFESLASQNTTDVEWTFEGGEPATSTDKAPSVTYAQAGVYGVTMTAKNADGEAEKSESGYIVVADAAAGDLALLSQGMKTEATAFVNSNEAPEFAVDGDVTKKWCATGTPPHEITIDLGGVKTISGVTISHAEAGGESPDMNTKSYVISVSEDGTEFTDVKTVTRNTLDVSKDTFAPVNAQYVKISIVKPTQGSDTAARIYEIEVYGVDAAVDAAAGAGAAAGTEGAAPEGTEALDAAAGTEALVPEGTEAQ